MSYLKRALASALSDVDLTGITDTQLLVYDAASGKVKPGNPAGSSEVAYSENVTGTTTSCSVTGAGSGTAVDVPNCNISVPTQTRPCWLYAELSGIQTTTGLGTANLLIVETTSGTVTKLNRSIPLPNTATANQRAFEIVGKLRLGTTSGTRTFKLQVQGSAPASNSPVWAAVNSAASPTWLLALVL